MALHRLAFVRANKTTDDTDVLPEAGAAEEEHLNSMAIFLVLAILGELVVVVGDLTGDVCFVGI